MTDQEIPSERIAADFILTGAGRLVTLAEQPQPEATGSLGVIERGALAARDGRIVWIGAEDALERAVAVEGTAKERRLDVGGGAGVPGLGDLPPPLRFARG